MTKKTGKKIVIIEDEIMLQEVLVERLTEEGYSVSGFSDAESALKYMAKQKPDVILTDLVMTKIDGFEILRIIKEGINLTGVPVLILSNLGQKEDIERAESLGAKDFLVKSDLSLEDIIERIKSVLVEKKDSKAIPKIKKSK